ncbi:MAG: hypothetical protein JJU00_06495 [Opitutales bacterium]|nr:hypothetical protein [Opitutales bacterium]
MLRIERLPMQENCLSFRILHRILLEESNGYGGHNDVTVEVLCANDALSTPLEWKLESTFTIANSERDNLSSRETGKFSNRQLTRSVNGIEYTFDISGRLAANWCLFDALQRSISDSHEPFTLFEGFNLIREGHRVRRRPDLDEAFDTATGNLRCSTQLGRGILPYEYWLDSSNRLVAAISGTRIYFLDDKAEEAIADREHNQFIYSGRGAWIPKI